MRVIRRHRVSINDANAHTTQFLCDARKRLLQTTYADGTTVKNAYDGPGNLTGVTDQAGKTVNYTFDASRLPRTSLPGKYPAAAH